MTDTKHTPGKWEAWKSPEGWVVRAQWIDDEGRRNTWFPATMNNNINHDSEANARLIAAAPDLLEFAVMFLGWREYSSHGEFPFDRLAETARAAIAKGEQGQ